MIRKIKSIINVLLGIKRGSSYISLQANLIGSKLLGFNIVGKNAHVVNSIIDEYTSIGRNTNIINSEIGKYCSISWNVTVGATMHPLNHISTHAFPYISFFNFVKTNKRFETKTFIGNDVWIGANAILMPGVRVGNGSIIGAGAIVTKNVPPYAIVIGNPGNVLKYRFSSEIIDKLESLMWYQWPKHFIMENIGSFTQELTYDKLILLEEKLKIKLAE